MFDEDGKIIQKNKELILQDGSVHKVGGVEKKKVVSEDGREIKDPIVVSSEEFTNLVAAVQVFPLMRDMIVLLRATVENEVNIYDQRDNLELSEVGTRKRLKDTLDIVEAKLGSTQPPNKVN